MMYCLTFRNFILLLHLQTLEKKHYIRFNTLLLLLIYLFSNSPSILFHHHNFSITSYDKATACEKSIYYSEKSTDCNHQTHLFETTEKCLLCDQHTVSPHAAQKLFSFFFNEVGQICYANDIKIYFSLPLSGFGNRGPPSVSSLTV
jgi:hypothetical protein